MSKTILTPDMAKSVATFIQEFEEDFDQKYYENQI